MKQNLYILISIFVLFNFSNSTINCPSKVKKCFTDNVQLSNSVCYLPGKDGFGRDSQDTYYYKKCNAGEICSVDPLSGIGQCAKNIIKKKKGESCISMSECESLTCKEGKCTYIEDGDVCNENDNCGLNSFCMEHGAGNYRTCTPLKKEDEECVTDDYCGFNMACGIIKEGSSVCKQCIH